jgi:hypothetical protein
MAVGLTALIIAIMKLFPDLPLVKSLIHWLVEKPAEWLASARRHHIVFAALMLVLLIALPFAPETLATLHAVDLSLVTFALDVSFYIDAVAAMALVGAITHAIKGWRMVRLLVTKQGRPAVRSRRRQRAVRVRRPPANDDEDSSSDRIAA